MKKFLHFLSAALVLVLSACNGEVIFDEGETMPDPGPEIIPEATLTLTQTTVTLGGSQYDRAEAAFLETNQTKFTASADQTWVKGDFEGKVLYVEALESNKTGAERTATITVTAGEDDNTATATLTVTQQVWNEASEQPVLKLDSKDAELGAAVGATTDIKFESNKDQVTAVIEEGITWLDATVDQTDPANKVIKFKTLEANETGAIRSATVTITAGLEGNSTSETITIKQSVFIPTGIAVGAAYDDGIIAYIDSKNTYMLLLSLKTTKLAWSTEQVYIGTKQTSGDVEYSENGKIMTNLVKHTQNFATAYPAAKWCVDQGEGWYMPTRREYKNFFSTLKNISGSNDAVAGAKIYDVFLAALGGDPIEIAGHWTVSEHDAPNAYYLSPTSTSDPRDTKDKVKVVRAMKRISLPISE